MLGAAALLTTIVLGGCLPVVAGGLIYDNLDDRDARAKFTSDLDARNIEREKAGLKPLDWCSEAYKAKKSWAEGDKLCADRVKKYEAGDATALN
jgi:hypothetical protein